MEIPVRLDFDRHAPASSAAMSRLDRAAREELERVSDDHVPDEEWEAVAGHYSEDELGALVSLLVAINAWNAIGVSTHAWVPGSYEP